MNSAATDLTGSPRRASTRPVSGPVTGAGGGGPVTAVTLDVTLGRFALTLRTRTDVVDVCRDAAARLGADGLGVALALPGTLRLQLGASDRTAWLLEQAELTAGEGPGTQAQQTGVMVRTGDVTAPAETRWPVLRRHLRWSRPGVPVRAVIALAITDGRRTFGSVTVHSADPAGLDGLEPGDPDPSVHNRRSNRPTGPPR